MYFFLSSQAIKHELVDYSHHLRLPCHIKRKLFSSFEFQTHSSYFFEKHILADLSKLLRDDILAFKTEKLMEHIEFFSALPLHIAARIMSILRYELLMKHEILFHFHETDEMDTLFFVVSGTLAHYTPSGKNYDIVYSHIAEGNKKNLFYRCGDFPHC